MTNAQLLQDALERQRRSIETMIRLLNILEKDNEDMRAIINERIPL